MSIGSHSRAGSINHYSMHAEGLPPKDQSLSYDEVASSQDENCKSAGKTPPGSSASSPTKSARPLPSADEHGHALVSQSQQKALGNAQWHKSTEDVASAPSADAIAPVPEVANNLPSAAVLRQQIAAFLEKHFDKSAKKAAAIVERIPNNHNQVKLNNILNVMKEIRIGNGERYERLKKHLSYNSDYSSEDLAKTTPEQRLKLRALMLYLFSDLNPASYKDRNLLSAHIGGQSASIGLGVKAMDIQYLEKEYNTAFKDFNDYSESQGLRHLAEMVAYEIEPLRTVKEELKKMLFANL